MAAAKHDDELEALLFECPERLEDEGGRALDELCALHPARAAELRDAIEALRGVGMVQSVGEGEFPEQLGEYRPLRRLGGGGRGVVFRAEQPALGRDVAVKLIRPAQIYFPNPRERFQREIEAIARLAHPTDVQGREKLMATGVNTANTLNTLNTLSRFEEGEMQTTGALELEEVLVKEFSEVHSYRSGFALALNQSCQYVFRRGDQFLELVESTASVR